MCIAFPGKITKIEGNKTEVTYFNGTQHVMAGDEKITLGDWVLVQMGIIVKILSQEEAKAALDAWNIKPFPQQSP